MATTKGKRLNPFQHALKRPDTYIGSAKTTTSTVWIFDDETGTAVQKRIRFNPGLFNIVREILSNAIDNVWRSKENDTPLKKIEISVNTKSGEISVWNDGYCIPVHQEEYEYTEPRTGKVLTEELYPAEVFFGDMFAGTNYDDEETRKTSGRNGMGAKATNVFSSSFTVECANPEDKSKFIQVYTKNGTTRSEPEVSSFRNKYGYTLITFTPDYKYFQFPDPENPGITEEFVALLKLYAYEVAMITGSLVKFTLNGRGEPVSENIRVNNLEKFVRMFYPDTAANKMTSLEAPNGDECVMVEGDEPEIEETEDLTQISFVNGIRTKSGGIHVEAWRDTVIPALVRAFNARKPKRGEKTQLKTSAKAVYPYLHIFVRVEVDRPRFASQTKDELTEVFDSSSKSVPYKLYNARKKTEKEAWAKTLDLAVKRMLKWNFVFLLEEKLLAKLDRAMARKEGTSKKRVSMGSKADDANKAGTKESMKCTLHITEGLSAKAFVVRGIGSVTHGRDFHGAFAIKGKFLNVQNASVREINNNEEVQLLKQMLGLRHGVDYSDNANFKTLRYGKVSIVADADDDGIHIRGLLLNYFFTEFPGLIERGFVTSFSTAVAAAMYGKGKAAKKELFYSNPEFRRWYASPEALAIRGMDVKYYKGLGSINPKDAPGYFRDPKMVEYFMEGDEKDYMDLGFNEKSSDWRKTWITRDMKKAAVPTNPDKIILDFEDDSSDEEEESVEIEPEIAEYIYEGRLGLSSFVDQQLIIYHKMALRRALPGVWDGLKESQRKVLFAILLRKYRKTKDLEKVMGAVKEETGYHHGGKSLQDTATKMGQGYVGSNNIPLLQNDGEFGTRIEGGKDAAAPRYIATMEEEITRVIFSAHDDALLERLVEDDEPVEFRFFMPILPMLLVNGAKGVASGFSTDIPNYNPMDIVEWIETWLDEDGNTSDLPELIPWYRGYNGDIELIRTKAGKAVGWKSKGILEVGSGKGEKGWWHIRELPIGTWTKPFEEWLEYLETGTAPKGKKWKKKDVRGLSDIKNYSTVNTVHFMIKPTKDFKPDMDTPGNLKVMQKTRSLKNMVAIDENDYPHRFASPEDVLRFFCPRRLKYYQLRKDHLLDVMNRELMMASNRYRFVKGVVDKKLDLHQKKNALEVTLAGKPWKFDRIVSGKSTEASYEYLLSMQMRSMTVEKLAELKKEVDRLENEIAVLTAKTDQVLWREDLTAFRAAYKKFLKTRREE